MKPGNVSNPVILTTKRLPLRRMLYFSVDPTNYDTLTNPKHSNVSKS